MEKLKIVYEEKANNMLTQLQERDKQITEMHREIELAQEFPQSNQQLHSARSHQKRKLIDNNEDTDLESLDIEKFKEMIGYQLIPIREQATSITSTQEKILTMLAQKIANLPQSSEQPTQLNIEQTPTSGQKTQSKSSKINEKLKVMTFAEAMSKL